MRKFSVWVEVDRWRSLVDRMVRKKLVIGKVIRRL